MVADFPLKCNAYSSSIRMRFSVDVTMLSTLFSLINCTALSSSNALRISPPASFSFSNSIHLSHQTQIIQMPIFIRDDIVYHYHTIHGWYDVDAKFGAAIYIMLIYWNTICFFLCLENAPGTDQFRISGHKIPAYTIWQLFIPYQFIWNMFYSQSVHNSWCNHFFKRLLSEWIAAAFYQTSLTIQNLPSFFQAFPVCRSTLDTIQIPVYFWNRYWYRCFCHLSMVLTRSFMSCG